MLLHVVSPSAYVINLGLQSLFLGFVVGYLCLRLRGSYLSLATLAFPLIALGMLFAFPDFSGGELGISGLRRLASQQPVRVIAVTSGKGGVGKTNVAANIAVALGSRGRNTCLLDADLSLANVDVLLGLQPRFNLSHVVKGETDLRSTILRGPKNIRIVPAASGNFSMTDLPVAAQVGIIQAFPEPGLPLRRQKRLHHGRIEP